MRCLDPFRDLITIAPSGTHCAECGTIAYDQEDDVSWDDDEYLLSDHRGRGRWICCDCGS